MLALGLAALAACGGGTDHRPPATDSGPPAFEPGPWLTVDPSEERRLDGRDIYHQGPRQPPVSLHRVPVTLPLEPREVEGARLLVQVVLSDTGRVARARVLRDPPIGGLEQNILETRLVEALRQFRFEPARLHGDPVPVYYNLSLKMASEE